MKLIYKYFLPLLVLLFFNSCSSSKKYLTDHTKTHFNSVKLIDLTYSYNQDTKT